jgi:hypothetical protein
MNKHRILIAIATILILSSPPLLFGAQVTLIPSARIKWQYTDNLNLTESNKTSDYLTEISVGLTLAALWKTAGLTLTTRQGYVFYQDDTRLNTWRLPLNLHFWNEFSRRTRLDFFNNFIRTEDPEGDREVTTEDGQVIEPGDTSVRRGRDPFWRNTSRLRMTHQFGLENSLYGELYYSVLRNDSPDVQDNDRYSLRGGIDNWFNKWWGLNFYGQYTRGEFESSPDFDDLEGEITLSRRFNPRLQVYARYAQAVRYFDEISNDYIIYAPSAGFGYQIANDFDISIGLGYFYQQIDNEDDESAPFLESDINKLWDQRRWRVRLNASSGLNRNDFGAERLGFEYFAQLRTIGTYDFTPRLSGTSSLNLRYSDLINRGDRQDKRFGFGIGLAYYPLRWMTISLSYDFRAYDTTSNNPDYQENRITLIFNFSPVNPWRF